jgi:hypothetical protein
MGSGGHRDGDEKVATTDSGLGSGRWGYDTRVG